MARINPFWTAASCAVAGFILGAGVIGCSSKLQTRVHHFAAKLVHDRPSDNSIWAEKAPLFASTPADAKITLLGDSLTDFGDWNQLLPNVDLVAHGIPGETSEGLLERLRSGEKTGDTVFVEIGINDVPSGLSLDESKANISAILDQLRGKRVFLESPILTKIDRINERISDVAAYEKDLCSSGRCTFIDLNATMAKGGRLLDGYLVDDVHLSWRAYKAWAMAVMPYIRASTAG